LNGGISIPNKEQPIPRQFKARNTSIVPITEIVGCLRLTTKGKFMLTPVKPGAGRRPIHLLLLSSLLDREAIICNVPLRKHY